MLAPDEAKRRALEVIQESGWVDVTITCEQCARNEGCKFAFDWYNIDGDCLDSK